MKTSRLLILAAVTAAALAVSLQSHGQTKTVVLAPMGGVGTGTNVTITVGTNEVFELLYANWPGQQGTNTFCYPFVTVNIGGVNVLDNSYDDLLSIQQQRSTIAGPATIRLESNIDCVQGKYVFTYRITKQVDTFAPNTGVVIPADAGGPVSVILESSTNLITWVEAQPGSYGVSSAARYFRLRAVRN